MSAEFQDPLCCGASVSGLLFVVWVFFFFSIFQLQNNKNMQITTKTAGSAQADFFDDDFY